MTSVSAIHSPFLVYFKETTHALPAKHARLRTTLFLQASSMYDTGALLRPHMPLLVPELTIIASKVSVLRSIPFHQPNHFILSTQLGDALEALSLLVRTVLHDTRPPQHSARSTV